MDLGLLNILSGVKVDVWFRSGLRHIMFLGYQTICASFPHKAFAHHKDTRVPSYLIFIISMMVMQILIWRRTIQVSRRPNLLRGFMSSMTQRTTFQLMKLLSLNRYKRRSRHWQVLSVSLTRLTKTSLLNRKSYSDGTLDLDILSSNISKWLIHTGRLKVEGNSKAVANYESPKFDACDFGKVHCWPNKVNTTKKNHMKEKYLKKDHLLPVNMVSTYHYILRDPGRLYHTKGKSDPSDMFSGVCVFIDHSIGYVRIKHQVAINSTDTVKGKLTLGMESQSQVVVIKGYQTDNGIINESEFI